MEACAEGIERRDGRLHSRHTRYPRKTRRVGARYVVIRPVFIARIAGGKSGGLGTAREREELPAQPGRDERLRAAIGRMHENYLCLGSLADRCAGRHFAGNWRWLWTAVRSSVG
jgi:hypothetical protein